MRNITILLLILSCVFAGHIQAQTEFSKTGTQWKVNRFCYGIWNDTYINDDYFYELGTDTLLGDKNCKKLYLDKVLVGAFLEEDRKVWYYPFQEYVNIPDRVLLYDFSKEEGDKIESYRIPWNIGGNLSYCDFFDEPITLTVEDVYYECGRKIMVVSALADYYCREDAWIEGIGSPSGFWGAYEVAATDGVNRNTSLAQVFASDKSVLYYKGQVINPDYQSTFLRPGKTWEIQTPSNSIDKISIGEPRMINGYPSYPVYKGTYHYDGGYLYDVNGTIYWLFGGYYDDLLDCDQYLYSFDFSEADRIYLCVSHNVNMVYYVPPTYEPYTVTRTDRIQCMGKSLKRIVLEGKIKHVWLEDVGSLNLLLYLEGSGYHWDASEYKLLRCYVGDEVIYDSTDFPDGIEGIGASVPTYSIADGKLIVHDASGYRLSFYNLSGVEVYSQILSETTETVPLSAFSTTILIGKLQKGDAVISFKIGEIRK